MVFIPCFHEIGDAAGPWCVTASNLRHHISELLAHEFEFISPADLERAISCPGSRQCLITFDDARKGVFENGLPVLEEFGIHALIYATVGLTEGTDVPSSETYSEFMTWSELRGAAESGHSIGSHALRHRVLTHLGNRELEEEVSRSKLHIEDRVGYPCLHFAAPFGAIDRRMISLCEGAGYRTVAGGRGGPLNRWFVRREFAHNDSDLPYAARMQEARTGANAMVISHGAMPNALSAEAFDALSEFDELACGSSDVCAGLAGVPTECTEPFGLAGVGRIETHHLRQVGAARGYSPAVVILSASREPYVVRQLDPRDCEAVNDLFNLCFGLSRSPSEWRWKFLHEALPERALLWGAWYRKSLVGAYLGWPAALRARGERIEAYQIVDKCVHPEHRGAGVLRAMWATSTATIELRGGLAFGFLGGLAETIGVSCLGYQPVGAFMEYRLELAGLDASRTPWCVRRIDRLGASHGELLERAADESVCSLVRTPARMNWRYVDGGDPRFEILEVSNVAAQPCALMVIRREGELASLYDWVADRGEAEAYRAFLAAAVRVRESGIRSMRVILTESHPAAAFFRDAGASAVLPHNYTLVFQDGYAGSARNARLLEGVKWSMILGDSDL